MDLLIIKHGALGDVVRTSYFLPGLMQKHGQATRIFWLTSEAGAVLLRHYPQVFSIITDSSYLSDIGFDCIMSLDDDYEAAATATQLKCKQLIGAYLSSGKLTYSLDSAAWFDMGLISRYGKQEADRRKKENRKSHADIFSEILGISIDKGCFYNTSMIEQRWHQHVDAGSFRIGINPFAGKRWPSKALRLEELRKLITALLDIEIMQKKTKIYLFGEGENRKTLEEVTNDLKGYVEVLDTSASVLDFAAAIKSMDYLISSDSLAVHLAIAQCVRNLSFYAPTSAAEIDTFGTGIKLCSISHDYCSYRQDADNSTITSRRLLSTLCDDLSILNPKL
jgi:ADP-heptose:LPS heptosyltransferase